MPTLDFVVTTKNSQSTRARQVMSMFDVPPQDESRIEYKGSLPIEEHDWSIGLIVGPSGCGKSTVLREVFGAEKKFRWREASVIDDFSKSLTVAEIADACAAVGFNTVPAWLRPHGVLSNGEQFRILLARHLLETKGTIVMDEFTSVVDRQVAQIGCHAVQKYVRRRERQMVVASCHYDIVDWLQPDWTFEPATMKFTRRLLQRRPAVSAEITRVPWATWEIFSRYHYLTNELHRGARCYSVMIAGKPVAFVGILHKPHPTAKGLYGISRIVTLPDWQGLGLAFTLAKTVGGMYRALGRRLRHYPAHPPYVRQLAKDPAWQLVRRGRATEHKSRSLSMGGVGGRPCAVFEYVGEPWADRAQAKALVDEWRPPAR